MYCEAARVGSEHLLLELQIKKLLGPFKGLSQSLRREMMIGDVDKADILTSFDELVRNRLPLLWWSSRSPASEIDYRNRWLPPSHYYDWQYLVIGSSQSMLVSLWPKIAVAVKFWLCPLSPRQLKIL